MQVYPELTVGMQQARGGLRDLIDATLEQGRRITITRNARPVAVLVPQAWYATVVDALRLIDRYGCTNDTVGRCTDANSGRTRGAKYGAEAWCDACIAYDAINAASTPERRVQS